MWWKTGTSCSPQRCGAPRSATGHQGALTRLRCSAGQGCSSTEAGIEPGQWLPGAHLCHCSAGPAALGTRIATASVQQARHRTLFEFVFIYLFLWVLVPFFFVVYFLFLNSFSTLIRNITWFWLELLNLGLYCSSLYWIYNDKFWRLN